MCRHKCNQCGAQFFESVQLRDHIAYRHHGIQLYTCKYCNKGFNCRPTMIRHERKEHTNYLPYKCKHCTQVGDQFPAIAGPIMAFWTHMKKHESVQRSVLCWLVECPACQKLDCCSFVGQ